SHLFGITLQAMYLMNNPWKDPQIVSSSDVGIGDMIYAAMFQISNLATIDPSTYGPLLTSLNTSIHMPMDFGNGQTVPNFLDKLWGAGPDGAGNFLGGL